MCDVDGGGKGSLGGTNFDGGLDGLHIGLDLQIQKSLFTDATYRPRQHIGGFHSQHFAGTAEAKAERLRFALNDFDGHGNFLFAAFRPHLHLGVGSGGIEHGRFGHSTTSFDNDGAHAVVANR